ncbi:MAG: flavin reductase family protein [Desulfobacteraceae bacterium]|nr:flavin reductase family protein [Desulfobacteraceae bacterium]
MDRKAFRDLSYGLYIVTSKDNDKLNGQIANTVIQVTSKPPRVAVTISIENFTHELIKKSGVFGVSVLDDTADMKFIGPFGFKSGKDIDKFSNVEFKKAVTGAPLVTERTLSVLEAEITNSVELGTHTIFIGNVVNTEVLKSGQPLTYQYYHQVLKGKSPRNAPNYVPPE